MQFSTAGKNFILAVFQGNKSETSTGLLYVRVYRIPMSLLPDTQNCGLCMRRECKERFPRHRGLAIPACITTRACCTCHDAYRGRWLAVSFEVGGGENVPGIPGACASCSFAYLVRSPWTPGELGHRDKLVAYVSRC